MLPRRQKKIISILLVEFFCYKNVSLLSKFKHNTDVICAANVVCHIPDLADLIKSVDLMLTSKGVFIFEEPYLGSMFDKVSYDQIYDEHIYMFSVSSVQKIFNRFDMESNRCPSLKKHTVVP